MFWTVPGVYISSWWESVSNVTKIPIRNIIIYQLISEILRICLPIEILNYIHKLIDFIGKKNFFYLPFSRWNKFERISIYNIQVFVMLTAVDSYNLFLFLAVFDVITISAFKRY